MDSMHGLTPEARRRRTLAQAVMLAMGAVTAAGALTAAGTVQAATTLYGGGATLPATAYEGASDALNGSGTGTLAQTRLGVPASNDCSLFGEWLTNRAVGQHVTYCQTGSGTGRSVLDGTLNATGTCGNFTATPSGFGGANAFPDFSASDAPLSQTDLTAVAGLSGKASAVQIPAVAAAIGIVFNQVNGLSGTPTISDAQICSIFAGSFTNWTSLGFTGVTSQPITVVYRSDGSGTTFSMSNHLANVCGSTLNGGTMNYFTTTQAFTGVVAKDGNGANGFTTGSWVGASGNPGVVTQALAISGAIAYAEIEDAINHAPSLSYFKVTPSAFSNSHLDPISNFPGTLTVTTTTGAVVNGVTSVGIAVVSANATLSQPQCLVLTLPSSYAVGNSSTDYPIRGVSNLLAYYKGNGSTKAPLIRTLIGETIPSAATHDSVSTIGPSTGFAYLSDSSGNLSTSNISSCINN